MYIFLIVGRRRHVFPATESIKAHSTPQPEMLWTLKLLKHAMRKQRTWQPFRHSEHLAAKHLQIQLNASLPLQVKNKRRTRCLNKVQHLIYVNLIRYYLFHYLLYYVQYPVCALRKHRSLPLSGNQIGNVNLWLYEHELSSLEMRLPHILNPLLSIIPMKMIDSVPS